MKNDVAYANMDFIPDGAAYPERWATDARLWREREAAVGRARLNHAYGPGERQRLDMFHPSGKPEGLVVFVHGGYWLRFHPDIWSHSAPGLTARGWAVATPSYTLAPEASVAEITREIGKAIERVAMLVEGPIHVSGHSAGGHLAAQLGVLDGPPEVRVQAVVAGVLVGIGTRLANGCTSGHGVCGISRFSLRGIAATVFYLLAGGVTVAVFRQMLGVI